MPQALVMGLGHPRQEQFFGSLHKSGVRTHAAHTELKAKRFSRYIRSFIQLPEDEDGQLEALERFGQTTGENIFLIATNDDYVGLVSKNRERLSRYFNIPLPGWNIVESMMDRQQTYAVAEPLGISIPKTWHVKTEDELLHVVNGLDTDNFDHILKTLIVLSEPADDSAIRQTKAAPRDKQTMLMMCREIRQRTGDFPLIQQVIPGQADAAIGVTMLVGPDGNVMLSYCVQRLRLTTYKLAGAYVHPYSLGSVVWCQTVHDNEAVEKTRALVKAFGYTGLVVVEYRRHSETDELFLMKVEPRPVRATSLATKIGMDIPSALYAAFNDREVALASDYPDGVQWLWIQPYVQSFFTNEARNRKDLLRLLYRIPRIRAFGEDLSDPIPLVAGVAKLISRRARKT